MPKVLITGISGFIGLQCAYYFLKEGYEVRGTVRSLSNEKRIKPIHEALSEFSDRLELVEADLAQEQEKWNDVVRGCEYVSHVASPVVFEKVKDKEVLIGPAVKGTLGVLTACRDVGGVKRVVVTSSIVAIAGDTEEDGRTFTENDWVDLETQKNVEPYTESKVCAEKAAWKFVEELEEDKKFELVTVNPALVTGPGLDAAFASSQSVILLFMRKELPATVNIFLGLIDVRDVALAHVKAMETPEANGKRFILCESSRSMVEIAQVLSKEFTPQGYSIPTRVMPNWLVKTLAVFSTKLRVTSKYLGKKNFFDNSNMRNILKIDPREWESSVLAAAYSLIERGAVKKTANYKLREGLIDQ